VPFSSFDNAMPDDPDLCISTLPPPSFLRHARPHGDFFQPR
jgi:hypothetical protein